MEKDIESSIDELATQCPKLSAQTPKDCDLFLTKLGQVFSDAEKSKNKALYQKIYLLLAKIPPDVYNLHVSEFLRIQMKVSDRHIYKLFLESGSFEEFIGKNPDYFDSKNKLALFLMITLVKICPSKEIVLFLNEHLSEVHLIEKKFFIIEIYIKILDKINKKELYLDQIFPMILMAFSTAIQKFIKNKEKMDKNPDLITNKEIIVNFDKYAINLIRKILKECLNFQELQDPQIKQKIMSVNDIVEFSLESGEIKSKEVNPNLLIKHYLVCFAMDVIEGVMDALTSPFFNKPILSEFLDEIVQYLFDLTQTPMHYVTAFLTQTRYFTLTKRKPASIKENIKSYDKFYSYNCLATAQILCNILQKDQNFGLVFALKFQMNLLIPLIFENLRAQDSKVELFLPLLKHLEWILQNEKDINQGNLFNFDNLNIFNVPLPDFVNELLERCGNFNCNDENRKMLLDMSNILLDLPNELGKFKLIEGIISKSTNSNLLAYIINLTKKKVQFHLDQKSNDVLNTPIINSLKLQSLIEGCLNKNKFSGVTSKVDLLNDIINFVLYLLIKFNNFQTNNQGFVPLIENHLLHPSSKQVYERILTVLFSNEKEIKEELDSINSKKTEVSSDIKKQKEEKEKELNSFEVRSNQMLILLENLKKLREIKI